LRTDFPPLKAPRPERRRRSRRIALLAAPVLAAGMAAALFLVLGSDSAPPTVLPNSLVRYDPDTLEPTEVIPIGAGADLVVAAGNYVWVTHYMIGPHAVRQAGDHTLTRVDTRTNEAVVVGGGLSPCGLTADPSGDVWVANCYGPSLPGTLVRVGADDLRFKTVFSMPPGAETVRPLVYGGGSLWTSDVAGSAPTVVEQIDPETGKRRKFEMSYPTEPAAWSDGYGDLWGLQVDVERVARFHPATSSTKTIDPGLTHLGNVAVAGDLVWVGDWGAPRVARLQARGAPRARVIDLSAAGAPNPQAVVLFVEAGEGVVWATVPAAGQLWRIDPDTNVTTPINVPYFPAGVAVGPDAVWVTVRGENV
jgi:streptogramin lyase